jgi:hypothetical protein
MQPVSAERFVLRRSILWITRPPHSEKDAMTLMTTRFRFAKRAYVRTRNEDREHSLQNLR